MYLLLLPKTVLPRCACVYDAGHSIIVFSCGCKRNCWYWRPWYWSRNFAAQVERMPNSKEMVKEAMEGDRMLTMWVVGV